MQFLSPDAEDVVMAARLRDPAQIGAYRELVYAIHCRLRDYLRNHQAKDFADWLEPSWLTETGAPASQLIVEGDLAVDGKPISRAATEAIQTCEWIMTQRHRAIIWVVEDGENYSRVPVDT
jgi:hypothetical protein